MRTRKPASFLRLARALKEVHHETLSFKVTSVDSLVRVLIIHLVLCIQLFRVRNPFYIACLHIVGIELRKYLGEDPSLYFEELQILVDLGELCLFQLDIILSHPLSDRLHLCDDEVGLGVVGYFRLDEVIYLLQGRGSDGESVE